MAILNKEQVKKLIENRPSGVSEEQVVNSLLQRGHNIEGLGVQPKQIKRREGFLQDAARDVGETIGGLRSDIEGRADKVGEIQRERKSGEQGFLRSAFQTFGQGIGAASDVVGRTILGAGKAILPQVAEEAISNVAKTGVEKVTGFEPVQNLLNRYEVLKQENPALARDIESALNIGTFATDLATMGLTGGTAVKTANKAIDIAEKGVGLTGKGARRVGFELEGALTGTSQETLEEAFQATLRGGKEAEQLKQSLRGSVTPESLVENMRESVSRVRNNNTATYARNLAPIKNIPVNTTGVVDRLTSKLNDFGVKITKDGLDFSNSRFRTVPQAQNKIEQAYNELLSMGDKTSLGQVDITRQALRELTLVGDDASARSANALIEEAISAVKDSGKQVVGYEKLLGEFAENAEFLDEITRSLSTGDKATIDTAYRKLATSLKTNNERRMNLIRELDEITDGAILADIAGQQLSEILPRGLFKQIGAGLVAGGIATGGLSTAFLTPIIFASPRVAGEVVRALGLGTKKTKAIIDAIDSARKTLNDLDIPLPAVSPTVKGIQETQQEQSTP